MFRNALGNAVPVASTDRQARRVDTPFSRKIWLPKILYSALPYFYLFAGFGAILATLYINTWLWMLPHYLIFAAACLHMGISIYLRRRRAREDSD